MSDRARFVGLVAVMSLLVLCVSATLAKDVGDVEEVVESTATIYNGTEWNWQSQCTTEAYCSTCKYGAYKDPATNIIWCWATSCGNGSTDQFKTCRRGSGSCTEKYPAKTIPCSQCKGYLCGQQIGQVQPGGTCPNLTPPQTVCDCSGTNPDWDKGDWSQWTEC